MIGLLAWLFGFYLLFNREWCWGKFKKATNTERVLFGVIVFESALWYVTTR